MYAIETVNSSYFIDLGGLSNININFHTNKDGHFPLFIASAKGK